ncbi:hypothetical protein K432DRAFT_146535 [Lepidopterella palustris CBS 459.81]|uniref:Uncharacterized protein n=1 Tax=Lepidopterella palustris CBS 459.81 TaxID=1314670 RepID=A0A8E2JBH8_9PEZI|nr:hypothetical protein K432DRAFT_146535 [Lepidopterella palustris CBS 459.81]
MVQFLAPDNTFFFPPTSIPTLRHLPLPAPSPPNTVRYTTLIVHTRSFTKYLVPDNAFFLHIFASKYTPYEEAGRVVSNGTDRTKLFSHLQFHLLSLRASPRYKDLLFFFFFYLQPQGPGTTALEPKCAAKLDLLTIHTTHSAYSHSSQVPPRDKILSFQLKPKDLRANAPDPKETRASQPSYNHLAAPTSHSPRDNSFAFLFIQLQPQAPKSHSPGTGAL